MPLCNRCRSEAEIATHEGYSGERDTSLALGLDGSVCDGCGLSEGGPDVDD